MDQKGRGEVSFGKEFSVYGDASRDTIIFCVVGSHLSVMLKCDTSWVAAAASVIATYLGGLNVGRRVASSLRAANLGQRSRGGHLVWRSVIVSRARFADAQRRNLGGRRHQCWRSQCE
jgi:hypothetical protein